jgi:hypothetical protein
MKRHPLVFFVCTLVGLLTLGGCGSLERSDANEAKPSEDSLVTRFCGDAELLNVNGANDRSIGVLELQNDSAFLWITLNPASGMKLKSLSAFVGDYHQAPRRATGESIYEEFPIQANEFPNGGSWAARIPLDELEDCAFVALQFSVQSPAGILVGELLSGTGQQISSGVEYCMRRCDHRASTCRLDDPALLPRTVPQTQWSSDASLGDQLRAAFEVRYPNGLTIGCNHQIQFATAGDLLASLPMNGKPQPLTTTDLAVKAGKVDNQLAGELLTLDLAIQMDAHLPDFSAGLVPLYALEITRGAFEGWTLAELQKEGNIVLGACTSNFTPEQIAEVLHEVNENFVKGMPAGNVLRCKIQ